MTEPATTTLAPPAGVSGEQLRLLATQASRTLVPLMLADLLLLWILYTIGELRLGVLWFAAVTSTQVFRRIYARRLLANPPASEHLAATWWRVNGLFLLIGSMRAALIPLCFIHHDASAKFFITMMLMGLTAGGIASVAGNIRPFAMWAVPIFVVLISAWVVEGGVEGYGFAFLLVLMYLFVTAAILDQSRLLIESMRIREQNQGLLVSLEAERDKARAASEAKTRFFAAASHDLRQPLHALSLHAATLDLIATDERTRRVSEQLGRSLSHANALLEGLIDLSRLDAKAITPTLGAFALSGIFQSLENEFEIDFRQRSLQLTFSESPEGLWLLSDAELVLRILRNLVGNAMKFTQQGSVTVSARALDTGRVCVQVSDTGVGIALADQERVFEEFFQLGNPGRDRSRGLGLGLSIVRRLCELLDAPLTLTSAPGHGSQFEIMLARTNAVAVADEEVKRDYSVTPLRVLMVDDEEPVLAAASGFLTAAGWECVAVPGRREARAALSGGFCPDVLVLDVRLGDDNGIEVAEALRREFGAIPVLFVTGESDPKKMDAIRDSGHITINKPVDGPKLVDSISKLVPAEET